MQNTCLSDFATVESRDVSTLLGWAEACLSQQGIEESRLNAELLLAHATRCSRLELFLARNSTLAADQARCFTQCVLRRSKHEPLQYILGDTEFMGLTLGVDSRVLIPRPETELLVERALEAISAFGGGRMRILDIGAGSGNIAIAIGKRIPTAEIVAIDISPDALQVADLNLIRHGLKNVTLLEGDIFADLLRGQMFHMIVSNPPYVSVEEFAALQPEVKDYEPRNATTDNGDGLAFVRRIAAYARERLLPGGMLLVEIGYNQSFTAKEVFASAGLSDVHLFDDLAGIPRVVTGRSIAPIEGSA